MNRRYVVPEGERINVAGVLEKLGEDERAIAEGRVFVGKIRVVTRNAARPLRPGDEVRVSAPARLEQRPTAITLLYEDADLVCASKPVGLPTVPALQGSEHSLLAHVAKTCGVDPSALVTTSRLDRDVSGVVTFAKTSAAAKRIAEAREQGLLARRYVALSLRAPTCGERRGVWDAAIGRQDKPLLRAIEHARDAKPACSRFAVVAEAGAMPIATAIAMLALAPETGRTHQLRLHASHAGAPLLGDRDYGAGSARLVLPSGRVISLTRVALHCARVRVPRSSGEAMDVIAPIPADMASWWEALGGAPEAWDQALACDV